MKLSPEDISLYLTICKETEKVQKHSNSYLILAIVFLILLVPLVFIRFEPNFVGVVLSTLILSGGTFSVLKLHILNQKIRYDSLTIEENAERLLKDASFEYFNSAKGEKFYPTKDYIFIIDFMERQRPKNSIPPFLISRILLIMLAISWAVSVLFQLGVVKAF